ncbi:hypothetical protein PPS11_29343 [Pseudomonas putida S11]|nr:hypothetical protein PPS11_29343 [Pseudomonas putida S11]
MERLPAVQRPGHLCTEAEPGEGRPILVRPAWGAETETGQRKAQGRDSQLQRTAEVVGGGQEVIG